MFFLERGLLVTTLAKRIGTLDQQTAIGRLMRLMTGVALPFGVGRMGVLELVG